VAARYDAIVVGAGPAGSTTAYRLARAGARVMLLDRARFPRDKPCGGGLTLRAVRELPFSVEPVVEDTVHTFGFGLRYSRRAELRSAKPLVLMTQRRRLDAFLAEQAAEAGAEFRDGAKVTNVAPEGQVVLDGERVRGDVVVGADGANGVTARAVGLGARNVGVALEGNVAYDPDLRARYRGRAVIDVGVVPGGYAWVFPKGDHVNVGVGGWQSEGPRLRDHLARACSGYGVDVARLTDVRGHRLPMLGATKPPLRERVLLVGDAAGLVDPLSGDGMYEAFVSGRLAAEAVVGGGLAGYAAALARALARTEAVSFRVKGAFDRFPRLAFSVARTPLAWRLFCAVVRGDSAPADVSGLRAAPLRVLAALGS
jgi:geranylgeranyl reductase family protein